MPSFFDFCRQFWDISVELAPWFLFGTALAGMMTAILPADLLKRKLKGYRGVLAAVGVGVPLPLCSCAVIPTGIGLRRGGASEGASVGFLVSTPQTGLDSILVTAAFLGWTFAFYKVVVALLLGAVAGWVIEAITASKEQGNSKSEKPAPKKSLLVLNNPAPDQAEAEETSHEGSCCSHGEPASEGVWNRFFSTCVELIRSVYLWLLIGIIASAIISGFLTQDTSKWIAAQPVWLQTVAVLGISAPLYVCATASVPIAATLVSKGITVGSTLVFLMAGPATNLATLGAVWKSFSRTAFWAYLLTVIIGSVLAAIAFEYLFSLGIEQSHQHDHNHNNLISIISAVILLGSCGYFFVKDLLSGSLFSKIKFW